MTDLHTYARTLPSQGGVEIGLWLEKYAAEVPQGSAIVELGCWLGAGTAYLALGARKSGAEIHVWDRFFCPNEEERDKAAKFGVELQIGEDTLPRVRKSLAPFGAKIYFNKGSFKPGVKAAASWNGGPIGLYVDDLTKTALYWGHAMRVFKPFFVPGTVLVLMDYWFWADLKEKGNKNWQNYLVQKKYIEAHAGEFELIEERMGGTSAAAFRYLG